MPWIFAAFVIAAIATAIVSWRAQNARREALQKLARELGLDFHSGDDHHHDEAYRQFSIFRRGRRRVAQNTLRGSIQLFDRPCRMRCGDFRYEVDSGNDGGTTTHRFSYLIVHPPWATPSLLIRREGLFDKLKGALGFEDIDFESEEFSSKYFVQASDKRFAYDVLHPRMMELLLAKNPPRIDIEGGALCLSEGNRRWEPAEFRRQLAFLDAFCERWPRHLVQDLEA